MFLYVLRYDVSIEPGWRVMQNFASNVFRNSYEIHIVPCILYNINPNHHGVLNPLYVMGGAYRAPPSNIGVGPPGAKIFGTKIHPTMLSRYPHPNLK